jgi:hypothetical protein
MGVMEFYRFTHIYDTHLMMCLQVAPVIPFVEDASAAGSETSLLQQMRTRISWMEKDLMGIHAMEAVIKKKDELAMKAERYTLSELQKAIESLNCDYSIILRFPQFLGYFSLVPELLHYLLYQS